MSDPYAGYVMPASSYMKWEQVGQIVSGVLTNVRTGRNYDNTADIPELDIRQADGSEITVACGQINLLSQVLTLRPPVGAQISIAFTGFNGQSKSFSVEVAPGMAAAPAAAPVQAQVVQHAPQPVAPAAPVAPVAQPAPAVAQPPVA